MKYIFFSKLVLLLFQSRRYFILPAASLRREKQGEEHSNNHKLEEMPCHSCRVGYIRLQRLVVGWRFCNHCAHIFLWRFISSYAVVLKIDTVEGIGQRLQGVVPYCRFQLALPHGDAMPAHCGKLVLLFYVASAVALYLGGPEFRVALRDHIVFAALMPMPETTVDEDDCAVFA